MTWRALLAAPMLAGAMAAQDAPAPRAPLPADWAARDLEGKWVAYRRAIDGAKDGKREGATWTAALGEQRELELLEWIVIFEGSQDALTALARAEAPQLLRAAVWNLANFDSHGQEAAQKVLLARAPRVRAWLDANRNVDSAALRSFRAKLDAAGEYAEADAKDLPALDPMQVLVPWLDAPSELHPFGDRTAAEPKLRYVHQVLRALSGVLVNGDADERIVTKVIRLTAHAHPEVRRAAFDTLSKLPPGYVPFDAMLKVVDDAEASEARRRMAVMVLSFSSHPRVQPELVRLVLDAAHPAREVAVTRLGEAGDPVGIEPLRAVANSVPRGPAVGVFQVLGAVDHRARERVFAQPAMARLLLQRVAWLRASRDPSAAVVLKATAALLRSQSQNGDLAAIVRAAANLPESPSPFRGEEAERIQRELAKLFDELTASAK